ncbi:MAG: phosphatidylglycerol lysyltransferase domain-containing protein [Phascolarctobacterium sp.]|nr:phosphatidylglycerol lysyltransferase domain-containing protein [Phascolarctobacterium sp.]
MDQGGFTILKFKEVTLADKEIIDSFVRKEGFHSCDGAFTNYFVWHKAFKTFWCIEDGFLIIKARRYGEDFFMPPFGGKDEDLLGVMKKIMDENNGNLCMHGVAVEFKERIEKVMPELDFSEDREDWDYVYLQEKLATLSGRKLHGQKNHYNAFVKEHPDYTYEPITQANIHECLALGNAWCDSRVQEDPSIEEEREALTESLKYFDELGLRGGCLRWDGKVQAFSYGTKINSDTAVLHVEKAVRGIRGAYIAMTKEFAAHAWTDVRYLNREEDMGIPGLRKAKLDLKPEFMVVKYNVHHGVCKVPRREDVYSQNGEEN